MDGSFDAKKRKRAYLRAVGPDEGASASSNPEAWTGASIRSFDSNFDAAKNDDKRESTAEPEGTDVGTTPEEIDRQIEETLRGPEDRPFEDRQY